MTLVTSSLRDTVISSMLPTTSGSSDHIAPEVLMARRALTSEGDQACSGTSTDALWLVLSMTRLRGACRSCFDRAAGRCLGALGLHLGESKLIDLIRFRE